jgi:hypothetical protein
MSDHDILTELRKQTKHLGTISAILQIFALLVALFIALTICNLLNVI